MQLVCKVDFIINTKGIGWLIHKRLVLWIAFNLVPIFLVDALFQGGDLGLNVDATVHVPGVTTWAYSQ
jgi:hypothetical protein